MSLCVLIRPKQRSLSCTHFSSTTKCTATHWKTLMSNNEKRHINIRKCNDQLSLWHI